MNNDKNSYTHGKGGGEEGKPYTWSISLSILYN